MTDDPLAHLYAEGLETDREEIRSSAMDHLAHLYADLVDEEEDLELPVVETSLDRLNGELDPERDEQISEKDVDELVLLVGARLEAENGLPDEEAAELGLGELRDGELVLNNVGRAVLARLVDERFPGIRP